MMEKKQQPKNDELFRVFRKCHKYCFYCILMALFCIERLLLKIKSNFIIGAFLLLC